MIESGLGLMSFHLHFYDQVKDTVEVDRNVTRHLKSELAATDWDLLVRVFSVKSELLYFNISFWRIVVLKS